MANLLHLQLSSPSSLRLVACVRRRFCSMNCHTSRRRFRFREEDKLSRDGGFIGFEFGNSKKKRPWWFDDDDYDDWTDEEEDWSMVVEVFRTLSWMLAPIGVSLPLGRDSNAGLMALTVPLVQSLLSLVVNKALSWPSIRTMKRSRRETFSRSVSVSSARTRKARLNENMGGGLDKGGYKSWVVGDVDSNSTSSRYGG